MNNQATGKPTRKLRLPLQALAFGAAMTVLVAGGVAMASQNGNSSSVDFTPPTGLSASAFKNAQLAIHTNTDYADTPSDANAIDRIRIYVDNDFKLNPGAVPTCNLSQVAGQNMSQAMNSCGDAKVNLGVGKTSRFLPGGPFAEIPGCVLIFNGKPSGGNPVVGVYVREFFPWAYPNGADCSNPSSNTNGSASFALAGQLKDATGSFAGVGDFNKMIDIDNIPHTLRISELRFTIKRDSYFQARCHDSNRIQNIRAEFTYGDASKDVATDSDAC